MKYTGQISADFGFYAILTDPLRGYDYLTNLCVEFELPFLQLRQKNVSEMKMLKTAELMRKITEKSTTKLIINDSLQVALDSGADGIHVGPEDCTPEYIRSLAGSALLVGLSTHTKTQAIDSTTKPIDYIGVGPVYPTPTKEIPDPVLGLKLMREMIESAMVPAIAIGGIDIDRIADVVAAGARNFSLVRPLCSTEDPRSAIKQVLEEYQRGLDHSQTREF